MHKFHTHINTNPEAILARISTRKLSDMFSKKKHTDGWRRKSTSHCQNTKQCWNLLLHGDLPLPCNVCVTSVPCCQLSWRARPPRCRNESKISIPSTHTLNQKKSHTVLAAAVCKLSSFATRKSPVVPPMLSLRVLAWPATSAIVVTASSVFSGSSHASGGSKVRLGSRSVYSSWVLCGMPGKNRIQMRVEWTYSMQKYTTGRAC
jgi:hypothetical protein